MANPTTNYGFVLPTPTDLVTDLPADFDVALQGVDTRLKALQPGTTSGDLAYSSATANTNVRLPIGSTNQVLSVVAGVPAWATTADVTPLTTKGDLFTFTTVDARIGVGANNTVLTADSAEASGLKWAAPSSPKVLQVVYASTTTRVINATNVVADTTLTATITPSLNTSKILVLYSQNGLRKSSNNSGNGLVITLLRGVSVIATGGILVGYTNTALENFPGSSSLCLLDEPATTSATTYKTQFRNDINVANVMVQEDQDLSTMILMEIGA